MSDDLDDLKRAFDVVTPEPDAAKRADTIAMAQQNFEALQGSRTDARPTKDAPKTRGALTGVFAMFDALTTRAGLTATTALAAFGLVMVVPVLREAPIDLTVEPAVMDAPFVAVQEEAAVDVEAPLAPMAAPAPSPKMSVQARSRGQEALSGLAFDDARVVVETDTEVFSNEQANGVQVTAETPVSTFSIDVDTASYSIVRSSLMNGALPPRDAVRVEEMVNYFPFDYAAPNDAPFATSLALMQTPWNPGAQLLRIAVQGELPEVEARPPLNLVFLIDTSGSMEQPNKLPLLKQSLRLMLGELRPEDQVAIVAYAGSAGQVLEPTLASERDVILGALERLSAGGGTNGQAGLEQAYALAAQMQEDGEVSRVLLATDGDFNVGMFTPDSLKEFIAEKRESGTYLSVLGFGRGNLDDATMQALAQNGNGTASYIDSLPEAQKVLVDQLSGALFTIAEDVKVQVEFNPAAVAEYRLIGYETRALRREDFNNDAVDAGEIGAGHQVTALYEIVPVGSEARLTDELRYARPDVSGDASELGFLKLRYKAPGTDESVLIEQAIPTELSADEDMRFAAAIAGFGQLLRGSDYLGDWDFEDARALARAARGDDPFGYRAEAIRLMQLAGSLSR